MKICIAGKNNIAVEITKYARTYFDERDIFIITNINDNGEDKFQLSFLKFASKNNLKIIKLEEAYELDDMLFLSLEFDRIIKPELFKSNRLYNIHFSLLPKYKGMYTSYWPLMNDEKESGVTLHKIEFGIDTGDIISQLAFDIDESMTAKQLYLKYIEKGIELIKNSFINIVDNDFIAKKQSYRNSSYYSKMSLNYGAMTIDLNQTAVNIKNQIRALNFRDYQLPSINGNMVTHVTITDEKATVIPRQLILEDEISYKFSTIDFNIIIFKDHFDTILRNCEVGNKYELEKMVNLGYDLNDQNSKGWTPLIVACYHGQIEIVKLLLKHNVDINKTNYNGTTPLMYAKNHCIRIDNYELIKVLLKNGADINIVDNNNKDLFAYIKEEYGTKKLEDFKNLVDNI